MDILKIPGIEKSDNFIFHTRESFQFCTISNCIKCLAIGRPVMMKMTAITITKTKHNKHNWKTVIPLLLIMFTALLVSCNDDGFNDLIKYESIPTVALIPQKGHPIPGNEGIISVGSIIGTGCELSWTGASDTETASADLEYRVYRSGSNNISTAADAETNGTAMTAWIKNMTTSTITGLLPGSVWYFNVLVRDGDGNRSAYAAVSASPLNVPVPGNLGLITTGASTTTNIQLFWTRATDVETPQAEIRYRVYRSASGNIGTYESAVAAVSGGTATLLVDWSPNMATHTVTGLTPGRTYYFNVFAMDGDGNVSDYNMVSASTQSDSLFLFSAGMFRGNLTTPTSASPRADIDGFCTDAKAALFPSLPCLNVRTFISISDADDIADMPANFGVPTNRRIISPGETLIASNWSDLLDGSIDETLHNAGIGNNFWWSGSDTHGNYYSSDECSDCSSCGNWTDGTNKSDGRCGATNKTDSDWINNGGSNCNNSLQVLCLCW